MKWNLVAHPRTSRPPQHKVAVSTLSQWAVDTWEFAFEISGAPQVRWPSQEPGRGQRRDGLWTTTCLELFVGAHAASAYVEWNFSPSLHWACYEFSAYRVAVARGLPAVEAAPGLSFQHLGESATLRVQLRNPLCIDPHQHERREVTNLSATALNLGWTAVIEELDGEKFYWALQHSSSAPDFHRAEDWIAKWDESGST